MGSLNKVQLIGRIGKDPETRTVNDKQVTNFSIACSEYWSKEDGSKQEKTEWVRCTAWGKTAETIQKYVKKGSLIYVEGKLQTRTYDKDGETRYVTDVLVNAIQFLDSKKTDTTTTTQETVKDYGNVPNRAPEMIPGLDKTEGLPF